MRQCSHFTSRPDERAFRQRNSLQSATSLNARKPWYGKQQAARLEHCRCSATPKGSNAELLSAQIARVMQSWMHVAIIPVTASQLRTTHHSSGELLSTIFRSRMPRRPHIFTGANTASLFAGRHASHPTFRCNMLHITDAMINATVTPGDAQAALEEAWSSWAGGRAAMQERIRSEASGVRLSTMGAVLPEQSVAGAKIRTTINGQFSFVIVLFSTDDGHLLASLDANAITRLRAAAGSVIVARRLARNESRVLALVGAGEQGQTHAQQLSSAYSLERIKVFDPYADVTTLRSLEIRCGVSLEHCPTGDSAVEGADIVVTATRSKVPVFSGETLSSRCFVAAIGSVSPDNRELDDIALARTDILAVEWKQQSLREAGELVRFAPDALRPPKKIVELADLISGRVAGRGEHTGIAIYKSVGVGLQDIALAGLAWKKIAESAA